MKNANKHADDLRSLFKRLMKDGKPGPKPEADPIHALVRGAMSFDVPESRVDEVMHVISREFVDLNELRVATDLEVAELLGSRYPAIERRVAMITQALNAIFEKEHTLRLDRLREVSKRDARQALRDLPGLSPFVEAYIMLFAFDGAAVPVDETALSYLRGHGVIEDATSADEAQRFLEHAVKAEDCYELYACIRRAAQGDEAKARKKAAR